MSRPLLLGSRLRTEVIARRGRADFFGVTQHWDKSGSIRDGSRRGRCLHGEKAPGTLRPWRGLETVSDTDDRLDVSAMHR